MTPAAEGVTFVVPVLNGARTVKRALSSIVAQRDARPFEIIAIDDGSIDGSLRVLSRLQREGTLRLIHGDRRGAAAAINAGIREATHAIICQIDQDVILQPGWLARILEGFGKRPIRIRRGASAYSPLRVDAIRKAQNRERVIHTDDHFRPDATVH